LIDEIDRSGPDFEAFLLELLSEKQVTIPEIGTLKAMSSPLVILTSNQTRPLSDALRRRCFYFWIDFPSPEKESRIVAHRFPGLSDQLVDRAVKLVDGIRQLALEKPPGVSETLDWIAAVAELHPNFQGDALAEPFLVALSALSKDREDSLAIREFLSSALPGNT
jgi:MoxR-like ATPase